MTKKFDASTINFNGKSWPTSAGSVGQALLQNASGNLVWTNVESLLSKTTSIDGSTATTTNLFTVPASQTVVVTKAIVSLVSQTGLTGTIKMGIGVAAGEEDIFASTRLNGFSSTGNVYVFNSLGISLLIPQNSIIKLGIDTPFGGTTNLTIYLYGYYL